MGFVLRISHLLTEKRNLRAPNRDTDVVVRMDISTVISGLFTVAITGCEARRG